MKQNYELGYKPFDPYEIKLYLDDDKAWQTYLGRLTFLRWSHQSVGLPEIEPPDYLDVMNMRKRALDEMSDGVAEIAIG